MFRPGKITSIIDHLFECKQSHFSRNSYFPLHKGIVIPTTPWESLWSAVADWFGVDESEMDFVLPNRNVFSNLWTAGDLYKD